MCVLIFSTNFVRNFYYSEKKCARYDQKCTFLFTEIIHYSCQILMTLNFLDIFYLFCTMAKNAQLSHKLSHSYMFRHYRDIECL